MRECTGYFIDNNRFGFAIEEQILSLKSTLLRSYLDKTEGKQCVGLSTNPEKNPSPLTRLENSRYIRCNVFKNIDFQGYLSMNTLKIVRF